MTDIARDSAIPWRGATLTVQVQEGNNESADLALIEAAKECRSAFGPLYERYFDQVYIYVRSRTGNAEDAADITQHVFIKALENISGYQHRGLPFAAWLFRIARNAVIDSQRRKRPALPWAVAMKAVAADEAQDPEKSAVQDEDLRQLYRLVASLDAEKRDLLALRFGAELSCDEIARVVGKSEAAVKKQLARTLRLLREKRRGV